MKKVQFSLVSIISVALAITFSAFQSAHSSKKGINDTGQTPMNWYPVGTDNKITSTDPAHEGLTKSEANAADPCNDVTATICLYGTNSTVTVGQNVSGALEPVRILRNN